MYATLYFSIVHIAPTVGFWKTPSNVLASTKYSPARHLHMDYGRSGTLLHARLLGVSNQSSHAKNKLMRRAKLCILGTIVMAPEKNHRKMGENPKDLQAHRLPRYYTSAAPLFWVSQNMMSNTAVLAKRPGCRKGPSEPNDDTEGQFGLASSGLSRIAGAPGMPSLWPNHLCSYINQ